MDFQIKKRKNKYWNGGFIIKNCNLCDIMEWISKLKKKKEKKIVIFDDYENSSKIKITVFKSIILYCDVMKWYEISK